MTPLHYLDFDYSEDADGVGTFDALASVPEGRLPALLQEITHLLDWAHADFPPGPAPLDEGGTWHYDLSGVQEIATPLRLHHQPGTTCVVQPEAAGSTRYSVSLSLSGLPPFCDALRDTFEVD